MEYLKEEEIKSIIPTYKNVFEAIKDIRNDLKKNGIKKEEVEHLPYRNILSILGERGSGKTSVFSTFRNWLTTEENIVNDIVKDAKYKGDNHLNLIVPEMIEEGTDILGIILLNIKKLLEKKKNAIDNYYEKNSKSQRQEGYESCIFSDSDEINDKWSEVFRTYLMRTEGFTKIASENFSTFAEYSKEREKSLRSEVMLGEMIFDLFSNLSKIFSTNEEKCLTYIYIDDIDINQERCSEGVNTILRYLKHPSVVVFISGDIEKIHNELYLFEMQKEKMSTVRFPEVFQDLEERKRIYIYELLKKVLPFSNRFELIKLKNAQKKKFSYPGNINTYSESAKINNLEGLIKKAFFQNGDINTERDKTDIKKEDLVDCVYGIFDYKPRGIVTIWDVIERNFLNDIVGFSNDNTYKTENGVMGKSKEENKLRYHDLLESLIASNNILRKNSEIIHKCIQLENGTQINYELFLSHIYKVLQNDTLYESDKVQKDRDKLKLSLIEIIHLFYFFERISSDSSNLSGTLYSKMYNAIIRANQDRRIYINDTNAENVIMLYNELSKKIDINQQSDIYVNNEYFKSYREIVISLYGGIEMFEQEINAIDYDWNKNLKEIVNKLNDGYAEILEMLVEKFQGVEYDQEILAKERTYEELEVKVINTDNQDNTDLVEKSYESITEIRNCIIKNSIEYKIGELVITEIQKNEKDSNKKDVEKIVKENKEKLKRILEKSFIDKIREYISITKFANIWKVKSEVKEVTSLDIIMVIRSFVNFCDNKLQNYNWNTATTSHICKLMKGNLLNIYFSDKDLVEIFENIVTSDDNYNKSHNFSLVLTEFLGFKKNIIDKDKLGIDTLVEIINFQDINIFENSKKIYELLYYYDDISKGSSWKTRRHNFLIKFCEAVELHYIKEECNELLQDFMFINQNEIYDHYIMKSNEINYDSLDIRQFYYLFSGKNDASQLDEMVSGVKNKLLEQVDTYTYVEINIEQLNALLKSVKSQDIYQDIEKIKRELANSQKVRKSDCIELKEKLIQYIKILKEQKGSEYYASTLEVMVDKIFKEQEKLNTTCLVSNIIREEEKKVYQAEYEAQILVMKKFLQKTSEERRNKGE